MTTQKTATKAQKTVSVIAVYKFKLIARICFEVLASNESDKYTTCFNGDAQHGTCTCDGYEKYHLVCYHLKQLRPRALAYFESRQPETLAVRRARLAEKIGGDMPAIIAAMQAEEDAAAEVEEDAPDLAKAEASLKEQFAARQRAACQPVQQEDWHDEAKPTETKMAEMAQYYEKEVAIAEAKNWKESSGFGTQDFKMEVAPSGRLVPMR